MTLYNDIVSLVEQLCYKHKHVEQFEYWDRNRNRKRGEHESWQAPLLDQLAEQTINKGQPSKDDVFVAVHSFESKPPGNFEAISRAAEIQKGINRWAKVLNVPILNKPKDTLMSFMGNRLAGVGGSQQAALYKDLRKWRVWCAVVDCWDQVPWIPTIRCPVEPCGNLGTLRVVFSDWLGYCAECGTTWEGEDQVRSLARKIARNLAAKPTISITSTDLIATLDAMPDEDLSFL